MVVQHSFLYPKGYSRKKCEGHPLQRFFNFPFPQIEIGHALPFPPNWNLLTPPPLIKIQPPFSQIEYHPDYPIPPKLKYVESPAPPPKIELYLYPLTTILNKPPACDPLLNFNFLEKP